MASRVTRYKDNKDAAASYTFDDGYASSAQVAAIFESFGHPVTFYIIPSSVNDAEWSFWNDMASRGHEIGNHSMTHTIDMSNPALSDQTLDTEINGAYRVLVQKLGTRSMTFAFPWHQYTDRALAVAAQNHVSVRKMSLDEGEYSFVFFDQEHTKTLAEALSNANDTLRNTVNTGGWMVVGGHGVDGDGWSPVTSQFLRDHLTFARQFSSKLWIDTYLNVVRYRTCRSQVTPTVSAASSTQATIRLQGNYSSTLCTAPLTMSLPVKSMPGGKVIVRSADGKLIPTSIVDNKLLINARPGETVTAELAQ